MVFFLRSVKYSAPIINTYSYIFLTFFIHINCISQEILFQKIINPDSCKSVQYSRIVSSADRGYYSAVNVYEFTDTNTTQNVFIFKSKEDGKIVWSKRFESILYNSPPAIARWKESGLAMTIGSTDTATGIY